HDFYDVASHADVNHPVIVSGSTNENSAGTLHLNTLLDQNPLVRLSHAVSHHPRRCASGCRSGGGILAVVEDHARMQTSFGIDRLSRNKIEKLSSTSFKVSGRTSLVKMQIA